ncbi:MAG: radical SAM protein [Thermodesulfobacteriota bacterium]
MPSWLALRDSVLLRKLETPAVYQPDTDTLFEIDEDAFQFLLGCAETGVPESGAEDPEFIEYCLDEGILERRSRKPRPRQVAVKPGPVPSLRYLELQVTNRCNLRCLHCYLGPARAVDLTAAEVRQVLRQFEQMQGLRLLVSGGEPLLHPQFHQLNRMFRATKVRVVLLSNGTLIDRTVARELNVHEVQVSLDGMKAGHEALRGAGSFDKTLRAILDLREAGKAVSVATMVHKGNLDELDELAGLVRDLGAEEWSVDAPADAGTLSRNRSLLVPAEEAGRYLSYGFGGSLHEGGDKSLCGCHLMTITAQGTGCKCGYYTDRPVGHVREGLETLWARLPRQGTDALSCRCRHLDDCRGGCRYRAEKAGDPLGPDPVKCAAFGIRPA